MSIPQKYALLSDILSVLSAIRQDARWGSIPGNHRPLGISETSDVVSSRRGEDKLTEGLWKLQQSVLDIDDVGEHDVQSILSPFCALLRSPTYNDLIICSVLTALHSIFLKRIIHPLSVGLNPALRELCDCISKVNTLSIDAGDEVVLLKIMIVIQDIMSGPMGRCLGDAEVSILLDCMLKTCCQSQLSETLGRCAEETMHSIVRTVSVALLTLDPSEDENSLHINGETYSNGIQCNGSSSSMSYGLRSFLTLLTTLFTMLDPTNPDSTDAIRITVSGLLNTILEESGSHIPLFPSLKSITIQSGCKYLFHLARSPNLSLFQPAMQTLSTMLVTMRTHLKLQHELFISVFIDLAVSANDKGEAFADKKAVIYQAISVLSDNPSFVVDLFVNYDCDLACENVLERFVQFITKVISSSTGTTEYDRNDQYICAEILLAFVGNMTKRMEGESEERPPTHPTIQSLLKAHEKKQLLLKGAALFNSKSKDAIKFFEENQLIYTSSDMSKAASLAKFLKGCPRINKTVLGEFLSRPDMVDVLGEFIALFEFKQKSIVDALRELLEAFRLPGEAQQIARIAGAFASTYYASGPEDIKSEDAVYVLTYSMILLNTDQHSPQVQKRMTFEDYQKNLRGVNAGSDFSTDALHTIYESIRNMEIIMPEEQSGLIGFEYNWKNLLQRSEISGNYLMCNTSEFDPVLFTLSWEPIISSMIQLFCFDDEYIVEKAISGLKQSAALASHFEVPEAIDYIVDSLSQYTGLLSHDAEHGSNYASPEVSRLSIELGGNGRRQMATVLIFDIINCRCDSLRDSWIKIFEITQTLFLNSLLPTRLLQMSDIHGELTLIPHHLDRPKIIPARTGNGNGGLMSALSSYLMTPYGSNEDIRVPTESDIENTLRAKECVGSCQLDGVYDEIVKNLDSDTRLAAVQALEALFLRGSADVDEPLKDGSNHIRETHSYDPAEIFILETMVNIFCESPEGREDIWPVIFGHITKILSNPQHHNLLIERGVVSLLRLCISLAKHNDLRDQIYVSFDVLADLPRSIITSISEKMVEGVGIIIKHHREVIKSRTEWSCVAALLRTAIPSSDASNSLFELISGLISDEQVSRCSFPFLLSLLAEFSASAGAVVESDEVLSVIEHTIERGTTAVDLIYQLYLTIRTSAEFAEIPSAEVWRELALPLLTTLGKQCLNTSVDIRDTSLGHLQHILLGEPMTKSVLDNDHIEEIFNKVLFPLLDGVLSSQWEVDEISEDRLRAASLLCKFFIQFCIKENSATQENFGLLWIQVLDLLAALLYGDRNGRLHEAIRESLKTVLLVMHSEGILLPCTTEDAPDEHRRTLWIMTLERMERILPGFLVEVIHSHSNMPTSFKISLGL